MLHNIKLMVFNELWKVTQIILFVFDNSIGVWKKICIYDVTLTVPFISINNNNNNNNNCKYSKNKGPSSLRTVMPCPSNSSPTIEFL